MGCAREDRSALGESHERRQARREVGRRRVLLDRRTRDRRGDGLRRVAFGDVPARSCPRLRLWGRPAHPGPCRPVRRSLGRRHRAIDDRSREPIQPSPRDVPLLPERPGRSRAVRRCEFRLHLLEHRAPAHAAEGPATEPGRTRSRVGARRDLRLPTPERAAPRSRPEGWLAATQGAHQVNHPIVRPRPVSARATRADQSRTWPTHGHVGATGGRGSALHRFTRGQDDQCDAGLDGLRLVRFPLRGGQIAKAWRDDSRGPVGLLSLCSTHPLGSLAWAGLLPGDGPIGSCRVHLQTQRAAMMRAVRLHPPGGIDALSVDEIEVRQLGPGEALVRVHAAAITRDELDWPTDRLPAIVSYELSGVVEDLADDVGELAVGDDVFALTPFDRDGVAAEFAVVPAAFLAQKPMGLSHVESAALPLAGLTAWQGALRARRTATGSSASSSSARPAVWVTLRPSSPRGEGRTSSAPRRPAPPSSRATSGPSRCSTRSALRWKHRARRPRVRHGGRRRARPVGRRAA